MVHDKSIGLSPGVAMLQFIWAGSRANGQTNPTFLYSKNCAQELLYHMSMLILIQTIGGLHYTDHGTGQPHTRHPRHPTHSVQVRVHRISNSSNGSSKGDNQAGRRQVLPQAGRSAHHALHRNAHVRRIPVRQLGIARQTLPVRHRHWTGHQGLG